ncbi:protein MAIN-LIKE 1-like [Vigna unguiculata]|uniref:protein MAIN-LIKE 1-like n=1 Tax=Vigna unguiculata TaxID=3917 RepID=UPI001016D1E0|nr:protein MAIN-LIKE 1-like [Vigna unguiculata]
MEYDDWDQSYNEVSRWLQATQQTNTGTIFQLSGPSVNVDGEDATPKYIMERCFWFIMVENNNLLANMSVLRHQDDHITNQMWEENERVLRLRHHSIWILKYTDLIDPRVRMLIDQVGFGHVLKVDNMKINHLMVTTLYERWRIETHTFHMPLGETTVTLEDVSLQLGVPIDGEPFTSCSSGNLLKLCQKLLGDIQPENMFTGNQIKSSWLNTRFQELPNNANLGTIGQYAHTHILILIDSMLMLGTLASLVHFMYLPLLRDLVHVSNFSWRSVVLTCLYRALDHGTKFQQDNIGGCILLLQCWA